MFFLGSCPNFEQNPTVIFFSCFVTSGIWTFKEGKRKQPVVVLYLQMYFFWSYRYRVARLPWMIKRLLAAKLDSNISSSERCSFLLLWWNERRQRARATWEAIKTAAGASCRKELLGPRATKWQRLVRLHFNSASVSRQTGGGGGEEVTKRLSWSFKEINWSNFSTRTSLSEL